MLVFIVCRILYLHSSIGVQGKLSVVGIGQSHASRLLLVACKGSVRNFFFLRNVAGFWGCPFLSFPLEDSGYWPQLRLGFDQWALIVSACQCSENSEVPGCIVLLFCSRLSCSSDWSQEGIFPPGQICKGYACFAFLCSLGMVLFVGSSEHTLANYFPIIVITATISSAFTHNIECPWCFGYCALQLRMRV